MKNKVIIQDSFAKPAKFLSRRYRSFADDLLQLIKELENNPQLGSPIGGNVRKVRMAIKSKGKGKSGGARVITYVYLKGSTVHLLTVYDKSDQDTISDEVVSDLVKRVENLVMNRLK